MKITNNSPGKKILNINSSKQMSPENLGTEKGLGVEENAKKSVRLNLSERAQSFQKAKEIASKADVDDAKVARLQKLIDEGQYSVDASAVADRLVDEHLFTSD